MGRSTRQPDDSESGEWDAERNDRGDEFESIDGTATASGTVSDDDEHVSTADDEPIRSTGSGYVPVTVRETPGGDRTDAEVGSGGSRLDRRSMLWMGASAVVAAGTAVLSLSVFDDDAAVNGTDGVIGDGDRRVPNADSVRGVVGSEELPNVLLIEGAGGPDELAAYRFVVTDTVRRSRAGGASIGDENVVDGRTVTGVVADHLDAYRFSGDIEEFELDGPAALRLNGEPISVDALVE